MEKTEILRLRMRELRALLTEQSTTDSFLSGVLNQLEPLFTEIETGQIRPPCHGRFRNPFHSDDPKYGRNSAVFGAAAELRSALEDSQSQAWYKQAFGSPPQAER